MLESFERTCGFRFWNCTLLGSIVIVISSVESVVWCLPKLLMSATAWDSNLGLFSASASNCWLLLKIIWFKYSRRHWTKGLQSEWTWYRMLIKASIPCMKGPISSSISYTGSGSKLVSPRSFAPLLGCHSNSWNLLLWNTSLGWWEGWVVSFVLYIRMVNIFMRRRFFYYNSSTIRKYLTPCWLLGSVPFGSTISWRLCEDIWKQAGSEKGGWSRAFSCFLAASDHTILHRPLPTSLIRLDWLW